MDGAPSKMPVLLGLARHGFYIPRAKDGAHYRVGGGALRPPSSHTTVRTVPYTAVHEMFWNPSILVYRERSPSFSKSLTGIAWFI